MTSYFHNDAKRKIFIINFATYSSSGFQIWVSYIGSRKAIGALVLLSIFDSSIQRVNRVN